MTASSCLSAIKSILNGTL